MFNASESRNNSEFGFDNQMISSNNTDNVFISQKGFMTNKNYSKDIKEIDKNEKLINKKIQKEEMKNNYITKEKNNSSEKISLDNRIQKVYKEEDAIISKFNNKTYETKNSKYKEEKQGNLNQCIISEEDENVLSDNTNALKEKLIKVKNNKLFINPQNNNNNKKNVSFEVFQKNKVITPNPKEIK